MRVRKKLLYVVILGVLWNAEVVVSFLLTTTLLTGFMGGFLIGRLNLGTFLGILSTNQTTTPAAPAPVLNLPTLPSFPSFLLQRDQENIKAASGAIPQVYVQTESPFIFPSTVFPPTLQTITAPVVQSQPLTYQPQLTTLNYFEPVQVPVALDNQIRDRFIRQLALMDPLHCLPKIFCEVSADPYGAAVALDQGTIASVQHPPILHQQPLITQDQILAYQYLLQKQLTTTTTTAKPPSSTTVAPKATVNADTNDDNESGSDEDESGSDEVASEEENDEVDDDFEQYRKAEEHKIEMQALNEMVDEIDDPTTYYYILRDKKKQKDKRKKYSSKAQSFTDAIAYRDDVVASDDDTRTIIRYDEPSMYVNRRMGSEPPLPPLPPPAPPYPSFFMRATTEAPLKDMFSDDPFFEDFDRSTRQSRSSRMKRNVQVNDLMKQYRIAYLVAEKYRSASVCSTAFPTCPYQTKTIMSVVNRLESGKLSFPLNGGSTKYPKNENNIDQFRNFLSAIERLNKAALQAQQRGEPVNEKVAEIASSPGIMIDANTSQNIVQEFQEVVAKIKTVKMNKGKGKRKKAKKPNRKNYNELHYYKKAQMENLKPTERIATQSTAHIRQQDDEILNSKQKWNNVASFTQTYTTMFKTTRPKGSSTTRPKFKPTKNPTRSTSGTVVTKPIKKITETGAGEDDEKDDRDTEDAIHLLMSKNKPNRSPIV